MQTYRVEVTISKDGMLTITRLPFRAGDKVEVIVRSRAEKCADGGRYPLHGKPVRYVAPFDSVAEEEWDAVG